MKRQRIPGFASLTGLLQTPEFLFLIALFLCGVVAGSVSGLSAAGQGSAQSFQQLLQKQASEPDWLRIIGMTMAWPVLALLMGWVRPGGLFISSAVAWRGFLLAFSISLMLGELQMEGVWLSLRSFGLQAILSVPCLLAISAAAFCAAQEHPRGGRWGYFYALGKYRGAIAFCLLLSLLSVSLRFLSL